ncbi:unnamed protein product [Pieris brassicae]|uniref:Uncharacterized protein n=1 Tax=Pieris brassicae TaxID=7116 RepID=A0A9P0TVT6_PIEBR|nr:unnamed protein product [Pieris brassicae]
MKNIPKKSPGIDCSRCNRIVHADPICEKLSNKQLNTLRNSSSIEWSCDECQKSRRSSFITPSDDFDDKDDEESEPNKQVNISNLDVKQLVADISRELKKTFKEAMGHIEFSLNL